MPVSKRVVALELLWDRRWVLGCRFIADLWAEVEEGKVLQLFYVSGLA
jgi:hypothetical protein